MTRPTSSCAAKTTADIRLDRGLRDALREFEQRYFELHLANADGSITQVAASSGMERTHLYRKLKSLGFELRTLSPPSGRSPEPVTDVASSAPETGTLWFPQQLERG